MRDVGTADQFLAAVAKPAEALVYKLVLGDHRVVVKSALALFLIASYQVVMHL